MVGTSIHLHYREAGSAEFACQIVINEVTGTPVMRIGNGSEIVFFLETQHIDQIEAAIARYRERTAAQPTEDTADQATLSTQKG